MSDGFALFDADAHAGGPPPLPAGVHRVRVVTVVTVPDGTTALPLDRVAADVTDRLRARGVGQPTIRTSGGATLHVAGAVIVEADAPHSAAIAALADVTRQALADHRDAQLEGGAP